MGRGKRGKTPKDLTVMVDAALAAGWRERHTRDGYMYFPPDGQPPVVVHLTPRAGTTRSLANMRAQFRQSGLDI